MRIVIIGAGISGLLSAYYLLKRGHHVHVVESGSVVASKASGANAAQLSYTYVNPIGSPSLLKMLPSVLLGKNPGFQLRKMNSEALRWGIKLLLQSTQSHFLRNRSVLLAHSLRSRALFEQLQQETAIGLTGHSKGKMQVFHMEKLLESARLFSKELEQHGISQQWLNEEEVHQRLGTFKLDDSMVGAVYSDVDETANCPQFCNDLLAYLQSISEFTIQFDSPIKKWHVNRQVNAIETEKGEMLEADRFLLCTGAQTNRLVKSIGLSFPIYPIKGYTLVYHTKTSLSCSVTDHKNKVVFVPLDEHVLVSGMFHIGEYGDEIDESTIEHIHRCAVERLPELANVDYDVRCGLRPCTPSSLPIMAQTKYDNLYINSGQGMYGWTLAPACADEIAAMISDDA